MDILSILAREISKQPLKIKFFRPFCVSEPFQEFQLDLADYAKLSDHNDGYRFLLVVVDTFSRFTWVHPVRTKRPREIASSLEKLFRKGQIPKVVYSDRGLEFRGLEVRQLLKTWNAQSWLTNSHASIVERKIRTLKRHFAIDMEARNSKRWIAHMAKIVRKLNNMKNGFTGYKPAETLREWVSQRRNSSIWKKIKHRFDLRCKKARNPQPTRFIQNELVRISFKRSIFAKKYTNNFSRELFYIHRIVNFTRPPTYVLRDRKNQVIQGQFVDEELQKTIIKRVNTIGKEYSVCLLHGFDGEYLIPNRFLI